MVCFCACMESASATISGIERAREDNFALEGFSLHEMLSMNSSPIKLFKDKFFSKESVICYFYTLQVVQGNAVMCNKCLKCF